MRQKNDSMAFRRLAGLLAATVLGLALSTAAYADYVHGYFYYVIEDDSVTITAYTGTESVVTVPAMIAGYPVNAISADAFAGNEYVESVILPDTIGSVTHDAVDPDPEPAPESPSEPVTDVPAPPEEESVGEQPPSEVPEESTNGSDVPPSADSSEAPASSTPASSTPVSSGSSSVSQSSGRNTTGSNSAGNPVYVSGNTSRSSDGNRQGADAPAESSLPATSLEQVVSEEEIDIDDEVSSEEPTDGSPEADVEDESAPAVEPAANESKSLSGNRIAVLVVCGVLVLLCVLLLRRRRR